MEIVKDELHNLLVYVIRRPTTASCISHNLQPISFSDLVEEIRECSLHISCPRDECLGDVLWAVNIQCIMYCLSDYWCVCSCVVSYGVVLVVYV